MSISLSSFHRNFFLVCVINLIDIVLVLGGVKNSEFVAQNIVCDLNGQCICPEDPLTHRYLDLEDASCEHYYLCHLGRAFKKKCDVRLAFHPEVGECIPRQQIPEKICPFPVVCPPWRNRYVEDPDDCTKYYLCFYQRPSHYGCPEGNYFDPDKEKCIADKAQAEICSDQALKNKGERLNIKVAPKKTSNALSKANASAGNSTRISQKSPADKNPAKLSADPVKKMSTSLGRSFV